MYTYSRNVKMIINRDRNILLNLHKFLSLVRADTQHALAKSLANSLTWIAQNVIYLEMLIQFKPYCTHT